MEHWEMEARTKTCGPLLVQFLIGTHNVTVSALLRTHATAAFIVVRILHAKKFTPLEVCASTGLPQEPGEKDAGNITALCPLNIYRAQISSCESK